VQLDVKPTADGREALRAVRRALDAAVSALHRAARGVAAGT
jgi:hypothetical protein